MTTSSPTPSFRLYTLPPLSIVLLTRLPGKPWPTAPTDDSNEAPAISLLLNADTLSGMTPAAKASISLIASAAGGAVVADADEAARQRLCGNRAIDDCVGGSVEVQRTCTGVIVPSRYRVLASD